MGHDDPASVMKAFRCQRDGDFSVFESLGYDDFEKGDEISWQGMQYRSDIGQ